jgi:hypothetical protein
VVASVTVIAGRPGGRSVLQLAEIPPGDGIPQIPPGDPMPPDEPPAVDTMSVLQRANAESPLRIRRSGSAADFPAVDHPIADVPVACLPPGQPCLSVQLPSQPPLAKRSLPRAHGADGEDGPEVPEQAR